MSGKFGKSIKLINSFQKLNKQNRSSEFVWRINFQEHKLERIISKIGLHCTIFYLKIVLPSFVVSIKTVFFLDIFLADR